MTKQHAWCVMVCWALASGWGNAADAPKPQNEAAFRGKIVLFVRAAPSSGIGPGRVSSS